MPCYASECCEASRPAENKLCLLQHSVSPLQLTWLLALGALLPAVPCTSPGCWLLALEALLQTMAPTAAWLLWHKVRRAGNQPCMSPASDLLTLEHPEPYYVTALDSVWMRWNKISLHTYQAQEMLSIAEQSPALPEKASLQCICYNSHGRCYCSPLNTKWLLSMRRIQLLKTLVGAKP